MGRPRSIIFALFPQGLHCGFIVVISLGNQQVALSCTIHPLSQEKGGSWKCRSPTPRVIWGIRAPMGRLRLIESKVQISDNDRRRESQSSIEWRYVQTILVYGVKLKRSRGERKNSNQRRGRFVMLRFGCHPSPSTKLNPHHARSRPGKRGRKGIVVQSLGSTVR